MESFLCNMILSRAIPDARIHRPSRIVNMQARKANIEQLDQWASSVRKLTGILNKVIDSLVPLLFTGKKPRKLLHEYVNVLVGD
ncbi:unnamed protein product [Toxocara canis]|uniref:Uncharacterized protein n=1 Tax=Toxocara canis TaxID=6265 RepID=A0A183VFA7_TOXCA|nr:unnamed protein product [Toxocara canis]